MLQSTIFFPAVLAATVLLLTDLVASTPLKKLDRQVVEDEYDFIICGGMAFPLLHPKLPMALVPLNPPLPSRFPSHTPLQTFKTSY